MDGYAFDVTQLRSLRSSGATVWIEDAHIAPAPPDGGEVTFDYPHLQLFPGFIDQHCHGGGGFSFSDPDGAGIDGALQFHSHRGTTSLLASLISDTQPNLLRQIRALVPYFQRGEILGIHLEGPYLNPAARGCHAPEALRNPDRAEIEELLEAGEGAIRMVTIAPELPNAITVIGTLIDADVAVAIGHTAGEAEDVLSAVDAGATLVTHLFNAMPPMHHRSPGMVPTIMLDTSIVCELIADGHHVDPSMMRMAVNLLGVSRLALVSDATSAAGMESGGFMLGSEEIEVHDGVARSVATGALAGSTISLDSAVRNLVSDGVVPIQEASQCASATPASALRLRDRGSLVPGMRADIVGVSQVGEVELVVQGGRVIRRPGNEPH